MAKLNDKQVRALDGGATERLMGDGGGLYVRVRPGESAKAWVFRYMINGRARKLHIGFYPDVSLAEARKHAAALTALVRRGIDPIAEREAEKAALKVANDAKAAAQVAFAARITVASLFERWAVVDLIRRKDKGDGVRRMFEKDVLPALGNMAAVDVKRAHVTNVTDALLARGVTRTAKMVFSLIRQMFRFAVERGIVEADPTASIRKAAIGGKDVERDRVLSDSEIKELFRKVPEAGLTASTAAAVWIALSTCCRIGELLAARWCDIDLNRKEWIIPTSKNGKPHLVFLSEFAVAQFERIRNEAIDYCNVGNFPTSNGLSEWVYPNRDRSEPVSSKTVTKQLGDRQRGDATEPLSNRSQQTEALMLRGGRWGPHDLRRTGATLMVSLGVLPEVAERCLNHTEQNRIKRTYQRHSYVNEMQIAWEILGKHLDSLRYESVNNVVELRQAI